MEYFYPPDHFDRFRFSLFTVTYGGSISVGGPANHTDGPNPAFGGIYDGTNSLGDLIFHNGGSFELLTNFDYAIGASITATRSLSLGRYPLLVNGATSRRSPI